MVVGNHTMPSELMTKCSEGFFYCIAKWSYDVTNGLFFSMMLLAFSISIFMASINYGRVRAYCFASSIGMLGSIWLATMQLMPWWIATLFIVAGCFGIGAMTISER